MHCMKLILIMINNCLSLKIYHSIGSESGISGLKFINPNQNVASTNSLTVCGRFNYKKLGAESVIFDNIIWLQMRYPLTFIYFGDWREKNNPVYANYIVQNPNTQDFSVWYTNKWHHLCMAYDSKTNYITFVMVNLLVIINLY